MSNLAVVDVGTGPPLVLIPGIQGRWEYVQPAIDRLATSFRVLTFSLCGERGSKPSADPTLGLDGEAAQVSEVLDRRGIKNATICGISFGGLVALRFAATHPDRTTALILASTPGAGWHLRPRHELYARLPWIFGPLFLAESPFRLRAELEAAFPALSARCRFGLWQVGCLLRAPLSLQRMAQRAAVIAKATPLEDCSRIQSPTLVVVGERHLDRVVDVEATLTYVGAIHGAGLAVMKDTGHLGVITKPDLFASLVRSFVSSAVHSERLAG